MPASSVGILLFMAASNLYIKFYTTLKPWTMEARWHPAQKEKTSMSSS